MKKEDIAVAAQLLTGMKDGLIDLEKALKERNMDKVMTAKKTILDFQIKMGILL